MHGGKILGLGVWGFRGDEEILANRGSDGGPIWLIVAPMGRVLDFPVSDSCQDREAHSGFPNNEVLFLEVLLTRSITYWYLHFEPPLYGQPQL